MSKKRRSILRLYEYSIRLILPGLGDFDVEFIDDTVQLAAVDAEDFGGGGFLAFGFLQCFCYQSFLGGVENYKGSGAIIILTGIKITIIIANFAIHLKFYFWISLLRY
jgi:hypothetical protein